MAKLFRLTRRLHSDRPVGESINIESPPQKTGGGPLRVDVDRMKNALDTESFEMPPGLTREEKRQFILSVAKRQR